MEGNNIGKQRINYMEADDITILDLISTNNKYKYVGGVKLWIAMEEEGVVPGKTWQALKNRFRTKSLPNIHTFGLSQEFIQKFSGCHPGPARRKLRRKPKY